MEIIELDYIEFRSFPVDFVSDARFDWVEAEEMVHAICSLDRLVNGDAGSHMARAIIVWENGSELELEVDVRKDVDFGWEALKISLAGGAEPEDLELFDFNGHSPNNV